MESKRILVLLVAALVLAFAISNVSADNFGRITSVQVNNVETLYGAPMPNIAVFGGETVPVQVAFLSTQNATDARIKVWITGAKDYSVSTDRFDVVAGSVYSRTFSLQIPSNIDPTQPLTLMADVESESSGNVAPVSVSLSGERPSYVVDILNVNMDSSVEAGSPLALDIVLKNIGSQFATDTFVRATIPQLGIDQKSYFGDLSPVDQGGNVASASDAAERQMVINLPATAQAGIYTLQLEAYNSDSDTTLTKKFAIIGPSANSVVLSAANTQKFAVGEQATYTITLVNSGNKIEIYQLTPEATSDALNVNVEQPIVVVPAGSSQTVKVDVSSIKSDIYNFAVDVKSNGDLISKQSFTANVVDSGSKLIASGNTTVLLTVILAIIFIVLLVVLIVLLTRKPEKTKEFGESYY